MKFNVLIVFLVLFLESVFSFKLLLLFPFPAKSHSILGIALAKGLANAGHDVTILTPYPEEKLTTNLKYISLEDIKKLREKYEKEMSMSMFTKNTQSRTQVVFDFFTSLYLNKIVNEIVLNSTELQTLLKSNEHFDAIVVEHFLTDTLRGVIHHYQAPHIIFSTLGSNRLVNKLVGNPQPISYVPDVYTTNYMSIYDRACNLLVAIFFEICSYLSINLSQNRIMKKYFPSAPHLDDLLYNASLVLTNSHESINPAVPTVPNMIAIGGYHVQPPKELPKDLKQLMDNEKNGVIYFSLGTNLIPSQMPVHIKIAILKAFGARKEKILWKWDEEILEGKPDNVMISKWFPQQSILAHPNCKLFITHAGLLSAIETIDLGVPVLALPIFADQPLNAFRLTSMGVGRSLQLLEITEESLIECLDDLLHNPKYTENMKLRSKLLKDRPVHPMNLAIYWIEYVVRYQGAPHLRVAGTDLPFFQYLCLDIIGFLIIVFSLVVYLLLKFCSCRKLQIKTKKD